MKALLAVVTIVFCLVASAAVAGQWQGRTEPCAGSTNNWLTDHKAVGANMQGSYFHTLYLIVGFMCWADGTYEELIVSKVGGRYCRSARRNPQSRCP